MIIAGRQRILIDKNRKETVLLGHHVDIIKNVENLIFSDQLILQIHENLLNNNKISEIEVKTLPCIQKQLQIVYSL